VKINLEQSICNFKKMMQKLVYCIWNKFCLEDEEVNSNTIYFLNGFEFKVGGKTIDAMIDLKKKEKHENNSEGDFSLESLDFDLEIEGRPSLHSRTKSRKLKSQLDIISSVSNLEDDNSDFEWDKSDYHDRFDRSSGQIKDYFSNHFEISNKVIGKISSDGASSFTNHNTIKPSNELMNTFTLTCKFSSLTGEFRKCLKKRLEEPDNVSDHDQSNMISPKNIRRNTHIFQSFGDVASASKYSPSERNKN